MATSVTFTSLLIYRSIVFKNILLFLLILLVAVVPLALRYYEDSRNYEIQNLASKLEFFAERGAAWLDVEALMALTQPEDQQLPAYQTLLSTLQRIEREFDVDNAVVMRREADGHYTYVGIGHGQFGIGEDVHIHPWFPPTYKATEDTWQQGEMMHSQLFGGAVVDESLPQVVRALCHTVMGLNETALWRRFCSDNEHEFAQFLQINTPLKHDGKVVAILMLNKFAESVAEAVRAKTLKVIGTTVALLGLGLGLFGFISARMLRPLKTLTAATGEVAQGNLDVAVPPPRNRDEVGRLSETFADMLDGLRQRDFIRDTFGRYISKEVVEAVLGSPDGLKLGGEMREVTLLVSDLRGFSSLAARLDPHTIITIINRYLARMIEIIIRYRGTVDEFQGDGILAFFGAPLAASDDPERAIACAIEMQNALVEINAEQRQHGQPELAMGIGINVGEVLVGNIGSEQRTKYGAMGSPINTAYRIESFTVGGQILISPSLYERVRDLLQVRSTQEVHFKGLDDPVTLYDIKALGGPYQLALPDKTPEEFTPLAAPLPITCFPLQGKTVSQHAVSGYIVDLAPSSARATLEEAVAIHDNLKITLAPQGSQHFDVYAKVMAFETPQDSHAHPTVALEFTSLAAEAKTFLETQRAAGVHEGQRHAVNC